MILKILLFIEAAPDIWYEVWINLTEHDDLHDMIHQSLNDMEFGSTSPLKYHTRTFWLYGLENYQEEIIE